MCVWSLRPWRAFYGGENVVDQFADNETGTVQGPCWPVAGQHDAVRLENCTVKKSVCENDDFDLPGI